MRFAFIHTHAEQFHIVTMCRVLAVSKAGYYAWVDRSGRAPSARVHETLQLTAAITDIHHRSRRSYGSPRVHAELAAHGRHHSEKRVARLMREAGLRAKASRPFRVTTDSRHTLPIAANVLARDFSVTTAKCAGTGAGEGKCEGEGEGEGAGPRPLNRVWIGDITYLPTGEGWLYLAVILDLASRRVIGWAMRHAIDAALTRDALLMALHTRRPAAGVLHHTDRGSQYAAGAYQALLAAHGMTASMSRTGDCWDNAVAESFFASLKRELMTGTRWATRDAARTAVFDYIERWYNRERRHSSLGYLSPVAYERQLEITRAA
jgi:putative transposase